MTRGEISGRGGSGEAGRDRDSGIDGGDGGVGGGWGLVLGGVLDADAAILAARAGGERKSRDGGKRKN
jgi:hypothetical protein